MKKTSIITGGGRGIGLSIAKQMLHDGFNVVIIDVQDMNSVKENLKKHSKIREAISCMFKAILQA